MLKKTRIINFVLDQPDAEIRRKDLVRFICELNGIDYDPVACRGYYSVALQPRFESHYWTNPGGFLMKPSKKEPRHLYRVRRGVYGVKDAYGNVLGQCYDDAIVAGFAVKHIYNKNNEYEKPVTGQYDSATSADFRTPRMKNEQVVYDMNKSMKKLAEEEDNYLEERWDEAFEDFVGHAFNKARKVVDHKAFTDQSLNVTKPVNDEKEIRPLVTFGIRKEDGKDVYYVGLPNSNGDVLWMRLNQALNLYSGGKF